MNTKKQNLIYGVIWSVVGIAILYIEYIILRSIGAVGSWIADTIGATGDAHLGIVILTYTPLLALIIFILICAFLVFGLSITFFQDARDQ